jgi:hypothetical protein
MEAAGMSPQGLELDSLRIWAGCVVQPALILFIRPNALIRTNRMQLGSRQLSRSGVHRQQPAGAHSRASELRFPLFVLESRSYDARNVDGDNKESSMEEITS